MSIADPNCLHCKISLAIIQHYRDEQGLAPDQYPDLGSVEVVQLLTHLAQVVADTITPCEKGEQQLLCRVGIFSATVIKRAQERDQQEQGMRLQ